MFCWQPSKWPFMPLNTLRQPTIGLLGDLENEVKDTLDIKFSQNSAVPLMFISSDVKSVSIKPTLDLVHSRTGDKPCYMRSVHVAGCLFWGCLHKGRRYFALIIPAPHMQLRYTDTHKHIYIYHTRG